MSGTTTRSKAAANVEYVLTTLGFDEAAIKFLVEENGIRRIDVLESTSKEDLREMINESKGTLKRGDAILLEKFQQW